MYLIKYLRLKFMICCLLLPIIGNAQEDTIQRTSDSEQTYKAMGTYNQKVAEVSAYNDYELGITKARSMSKPALIYFNAYGAYNARKFDEAVLSDPKMMSIINSKYQLVVLVVDDRTPLHETKVAFSEALNRRLKTKGDYNLNLQIEKFGTDRQPMFFIVDPRGKIIDSTLYLNPNKFYKFLRRK